MDWPLLFNKQKKINQLSVKNKLKEIYGCNSGTYIMEVLKIEMFERLDIRVVQQSNQFVIVMQRHWVRCIFQILGSCVFLHLPHCLQCQNTLLEPQVFRSLTVRKDIKKGSTKPKLEWCNSHHTWYFSLFVRPRAH